jgi:ABC-type polar amino acid transport system ATPase subunit
MIKIKGLEKKHGARMILSNINLTFEPGRITCVCGPSGGGKTTLLRCINGLDTFEGGSVIVGAVAYRGTRAAADAAAVAQIRKGVGFVFQAYHLFAHRTVLQNIVEAPIYVAGLSDSDARSRASALLERLGLTHRAGAYPRELSGGEQQRVAIARALAMNPEALLFDEPTSALDPSRRVDVGRILSDLRNEKRTLVVVSHDMDFVRDIADDIVLLEQGRVMSAGTAKEVLAPSMERKEGL